MDHFAGLDVSVKETDVCIVDDTGSIVREVKVVSEPEALLQVLGNPIHRLKRIGHTSTSGRGLALCGLAFHNLAQGLVDPRLPAIPRRFEVFDHLGADAQATPACAFSTCSAWHSAARSPAAISASTPTARRGST